MIWTPGGSRWLSASMTDWTGAASNAGEQLAGSTIPFPCLQSLYNLGYGLSCWAPCRFGETHKTIKPRRCVSTRRHCAWETPGLPQLFEAAGATLPFDRVTVRDAAQFMTACLLQAGALSLP
jgi:hypothetical protein